MFVSLVTCRFDPTRATFDSGPLDAFVRDKVVLAVREYFFVQGETPHLAFVVTFRLIPPSAPDGTSGRLDSQGQARARRPSADDLRTRLEPPARERFDLLRDWRSAKSRDEGIPAYSVFTNRQLLALAEQAPRTRAGLQRVRGLGKKKAERYGASVLKVLGVEEAAKAPAPPPADVSQSAGERAADPSEVVPLFSAVGVEGAQA